MNELFSRYCNYTIKDYYIKKYGSKNIGGCLLEDVNVETGKLKINRYAKSEMVDIEKFCKEHEDAGGGMLLLAYTVTMTEVKDIKKITSSNTADFYMKMKRVLDSVADESMTENEWFMLEFLGEDYEVPQSLKRLYIEETESKYNRIGYYKEIVKKLGKGYDGKGLYVVDSLIDYSTHAPFMDIVLWAVGLYRRLSIKGMNSPKAYIEMAKSSFRKLICYRNDDGEEVIASVYEQKKYSSRCYTKNIKVLDMEEIANLHIVAWLMTGDEIMYKGSYLEQTGMKFSREWSDNNISIEEFCYRIKLSHSKILDALQYMSSSQFIDTDCKKLIDSVKKEDKDFLDSEYTEVEEIASKGEKEASMKEIIKAVAQIEPISKFEEMAKSIAQDAYKRKRFVLSEKQRNIVIKVYKACNVDKGQLSTEVVETIEFIKKYEGKGCRQIVKDIIKSVERYGKCTEKQLAILKAEEETIKDDLEGTGIKKKRSSKKFEGSDNTTSTSSNGSKFSMLGEEGAANIFGISFDIQKEK